MSNRSCDKIVITGLGCVSPLGMGLKYSWNALLEGKSSLVNLDSLADKGWIRGQTKCRGISPVPRGNGEGLYNDEDPFIDDKRYGSFIRYALLAAREALEDAGWTDLSGEQKEVTGVSIGSGIDLYTVENRAMQLGLCSPDEMILSQYGPFYIPSSISNMASGQVSIIFGLKGPNRSVGAACATGLYSIEDAASMIRKGDAKVVVAGATEGRLSMAALGGFDAMSALSRGYNDQPTLASRPYDQGRDGFIIAEGSGILILEDMAHAIKRGARIYAEYVSCGMTSDAYHLSAPSGEGSERAIKIALNRAGLAPSEIDHINAHATSTPRGDESEINSLSRVFGEHITKVKISALKASFGHALNAASGIESVFAIKSLYDQVVPPTINLTHPADFAKDLDIPAKATKSKIDYLLKTSFGFGGANAVSIFGRYVD